MRDTTTKFLKPESYYSRLYDEGTIDQCRWQEKNSNGEYTPKGKPKKGIKKKDLRARINFAPIINHFIKGERYIEKEKTVRKWMNKDEERDRKIENT